MFFSATMLLQGTVASHRRNDGVSQRLAPTNLVLQRCCSFMKGEEISPIYRPGIRPRWRVLARAKCGDANGGIESA